MLYVIAIIAVIISVAVDQFTKYLAITHLQTKPIPIIDGVFQLTYLENRGAAFGMLQNQQMYFLIVGVITLILISILYVKMPRNKHFIPLRICMIFITSGAIGNMIDRARFQYVVDFLYFELIDFPVFNVADIYATVSTTALIILFMFYYKESDIDCLFDVLKPRKKKENKDK